MINWRTYSISRLHVGNDPEGLVYWMGYNECICLLGEGVWDMVGNVGRAMLKIVNGMREVWKQYKERGLWTRGVWGSGIVRVSVSTGYWRSVSEVNCFHIEWLMSWFQKKMKKVFIYFQKMLKFVVMFCYNNTLIVSTIRRSISSKIELFMRLQYVSMWLRWILTHRFPLSWYESYLYQRILYLEAICDCFGQLTIRDLKYIDCVEN